MSNKIRSNVTVAENAMGGIYEATDNPDVFRISLQQKTVWWDKDKLCHDTRVVPYDTTCRLHKKGHIMPGNIIRVITLDAPGEWDEHWLIDQHGEQVITPDGYIVYTYCYYSPMSKYTVDGDLPEDTVLSDILHPENS